VKVILVICVLAQGAQLMEENKQLKQKVRIFVFLFYLFARNPCVVVGDRAFWTTDDGVVQGEKTCSCGLGHRYPGRRHVIGVCQQRLQLQ
jgi:hypothetical protein